MEKYYTIEPEVAGGWGENTVAATTPGGTTVVRKFHYQFDGWLGDELLTSTPCYIVTERLSNEIRNNNLTGVEFDNVEITVSGEFTDLYNDRQLPRFVWLKIIGKPKEDDFGMTPDILLVVSERALRLLRLFGISHAEIDEAI